MESKENKLREGFLCASLVELTIKRFVCTCPLLRQLVLLLCRSRELICLVLPTLFVSKR